MAGDVNVKITATDETPGVFAKVVEGAQGMKERVVDSVLEIGKVFGVVFAAEAVGEFFKSSVEESVKATRAYADIGQALKNIGIDAQTIKPVIEDTIEALSKKTGVSPTELTAAFARLLEITGNYKASIANLGIAVDVAAARHIDLNKAADLVGKTIDGNTKALRQLGVVVKEGETPIEALRRQYSGFAEAEANTVVGTLARLNVGWEELKKSVGDAILGNSEFVDSGNKLVGVLTSLEQWIKDNEVAIGNLVSAVVVVGNLVGGVIGKIVGAVDHMVVGFHQAALGIGAFFDAVSHPTEFLSRIKENEADITSLGKTGQTVAEIVASNNAKMAAARAKLTAEQAVGKIADQEDEQALKALHKAQQQTISDFKELSSTHKATQADLDALIKVEKALRQELDLGTASMHRRAEIVKELDEISKALGVDEQKILDEQHKRRVEAAGGGNQLKNTGTGNAGVNAANDQQGGVPSVLQGVNSGPEGTGTQAAIQDQQDDKAAKDKQTQIDNLTASLKQYSDAWVNVWEAIGKGKNVFKEITKELESEISKQALLKAKSEFAEGVAALASGIFSGSPNAFASATEHFAASALFGAIGGFAGSMASAGAASQRTQNQVGNSQGGGQIIVQGGILNMNDPAQADALAKALQTLSGRNVSVTAGP